MQTSDEIKARLHHSSHELRQTQQLLATVADRVQTAYDEIQVCSSRADLIDPTIDKLNCQINAMREDMDRLFALRNNDADQYLRQENAQLKKDVAALQQTLRLERGQHQAHLSDAVKSNEELNHRIQDLEQFNSLLKSKINEMKEKYEDAIIDIADMKGKKDTLQNNPRKHHKWLQTISTIH